MKHFLAACAVITALPLSAGAAIPIEQALELCRAEQNALRRLTCYDSITTSGHTTASMSGGTQTPAAPQAATTAIAKAATTVEAAPEADFGLEHRKSKEDTAEQMYSQVKSVQYSPRKELIVEFVNGQIWHQTGNEYYRIAAGEQHYVKRGVLNSFFLGNDSNNRTIRVRREK